MLTSNPKRSPETPMITISLPDIWRPVHLFSLEAKLFLLSSQQIIDLIPSCSHLSSLLLLLFISKHGVQPTPSWTRQRLCLSLTRQADLAAITPCLCNGPRFLSGRKENKPSLTLLDRWSFVFGNYKDAKILPDHRWGQYYFFSLLFQCIVYGKSKSTNGEPFG